MAVVLVEMTPGVQR